MFFRRSKTYLWEYKLREKFPEKAKGSPRREQLWFILIKTLKNFQRGAIWAKSNEESFSSFK